MDTKIILNAWNAIGDTTPMQTDCGALCSAACCAPDEDGKGGVCLLPGEEQLIGDPAWAKVTYEDAMQAPMIECSAMCARALRPFLCRIFPLCPTRGKNGWTVRMDARARAVCPLAANGLRAVDPEFARRCAKAVRIIASESDGEAFLERWAAIEAEFRKPIF